MKTTLSELIRLTQEAYDHEAACIAIHDAIAKVLETKRGKKITARIAGDVAKALGWATDERPVQYQITAGSLVQLNVWGSPTPWPKFTVSPSFFLGYAGGTIGDRRHVAHPDYGPEAFEETDACHGRAAKARNDKRRALLANPSLLKTLAKAIDAKVAAEKSLKALLEHEGPFDADRYSFEELSEVER